LVVTTKEMGDPCGRGVNALFAWHFAVAYQGLVIRDAGGLSGFGYFLLPQLPIALPQTIATTPILSGQVVLDANP
jgi:hypothetical protein